MLVLAPLAIVALFVAQAAALGGALMLLVGVLHHEVSTAVPAIGFLPSLGITLLTAIVVRAVTSR